MTTESQPKFAKLRVSSGSLGLRVCGSAGAAAPLCREPATRDHGEGTNSGRTSLRLGHRGVSTIYRHPGGLARRSRGVAVLPERRQGFVACPPIGPAGNNLQV
jgi:hypothetical protein